MSFSKKILIGLGAGVVVGVFLGERAAALDWLADGFVKLLQMTVLPQMTVSIVGGLGLLRESDAKGLGRRSAAVLGLLWAIALLFACLIPLTFPSVRSASFFSTSLVERRPPFDFVGLYIPANPFNSLANSVVPAVVLFSVLVGVALMRVEGKGKALELLDIASRTLKRVTRFIAALMPVGLFAIAATTAGTISVDQIGRLQVYLIAYVAVALLVALWVLPGLVAALTPIRVRDIFGSTRDALITAFVAADLFIVLPVLIESTKSLLRPHLPEERASLPDVIVPVAYNFPHTGKLLSLSFVLFAGWFADRAVDYSDYPAVAGMGLLTFFGSLNAAVPFLLDVFRIPADTFQLFLASGVINSRFGSLVAAVHTVALALLASSAIAGSLVWRRGPLLRYLGVTALLTIAVIGGSRVLFRTFLQQPYTKDQVLASMQLLHEPVADLVLHDGPDGLPREASAAVLDAIHARGRLRVGYMADSLPFAFVNVRGQPVGLDIELAHRLARDLGVGLELVALDRSRIDAVLADGTCDIVMSGVAATPERASTVLMSASYLDETLALVVPDGDREDYLTWDQIRRRGAVTFLMPDLPYYKAMVTTLAPEARLQPFDDLRAIFEHHERDAVIALPAERGSAWTLLYPDFSVVVPRPGSVKVPLAYPLARRDYAFAAFVNTWIDLKRKDGTIDAAYRYWILGQTAGPTAPRWSIVRNVLHWVD